MNRKKIGGAIKFIDSWLDFRYRINEWPGFTVAISHKGNVLFNKSYGYANIELREKLTPNHIFRIASHSKTFTAVSIMKLVEENKLKLNDLVIEYVPWLKDHKDKRFSKITIKHLLSHGAGVIRDGLDSNYWLLKRSFPNKNQFRKEVLEANLVFNSDKKMKYSNIGFSILGLVIEEVSGISYNEYVLENIIKPLNLKNTGPEYNAFIKDKLVTGYSRRGNDKKRLPLKRDIDTQAISPATGFYSTSEDLCKYFYAQTIGSGKLLSDESKKMMQKAEHKVPHSDLKDSYGLGIIIIPIGKRKMFGHSGGFPGQNTATMSGLSNQLIITVLTNCIDGNAIYFVRGLFSIFDYFEKNYSESNKLNLNRFEERLSNMWNITEVVSVGKHLVAVYPDSFNPFKDIEILKYVKNNTLKIGKTNGYYSEGELVHYSFDKNGKIKSVKYAGATMLPEK